MDQKVFLAKEEDQETKVTFESDLVVRMHKYGMFHTPMEHICEISDVKTPAQQCTRLKTRVTICILLEKSNNDTAIVFNTTFIDLIKEKLEIYMFQLFDMYLMYRFSWTSGTNR